MVVRLFSDSLVVVCERLLKSSSQPPGAPWWLGSPHSASCLLCVRRSALLGSGQECWSVWLDGSRTALCVVLLPTIPCSCLTIVPTNTCGSLPAPLLLLLFILFLLLTVIDGSVLTDDVEVGSLTFTLLYQSSLFFLRFHSEFLPHLSVTRLWVMLDKPVEACPLPRWPRSHNNATSSEQRKRPILKYKADYLSLIWNILSDVFRELLSSTAQQKIPKLLLYNQ